MAEETFADLMHAVNQGFEAGLWSTTLERIEAALLCFPERATLLNYYRACLNVRLDRHDQVLTILQGILDSGVWMSEDLLRKAPSFVSLQGQTEFEALVVRSVALREADPEAGRRDAVILEPAGPQPWPLLLALHGNNTRAGDFAPAWEAARAAGWLVVVPQSGQALWTGHYVWNDQSVGVAEVLDCYRTIAARYSLDRKRMILAGHSMGGQLALRLALGGSPAVGGFILVGPYFPPLEEWEALISGAQGRALRGKVFLGENDVALPKERVRAVVERLNTAGIVCQLEMLPERGHEVPPDFGELLGAAMIFVED